MTMVTLAPKTLTNAEIEAVLTTCQDNPRNHLIMRIALGTALRLSEIARLDVGQVYRDGRTVARTRVKIKGNRIEDVLISSKLQTHISGFISWKINNRENVSPDAPLFLSNRGRRLSTRQMQTLFQDIQERAGLSRRQNFHALRHTAITSLIENAGGDILSAQRFARHRKIETTLRYAHPSDERMLRQLEQLPF